MKAALIAWIMLSQTQIGVCLKEAPTFQDNHVRRRMESAQIISYPCGSVVEACGPCPSLDELLENACDYCISTTENEHDFSDDFFKISGMILLPTNALLGIAVAVKCLSKGCCNSSDDDDSEDSSHSLSSD